MIEESTSVRTTPTKRHLRGILPNKGVGEGEREIEIEERRGLQNHLKVSSVERRRSSTAAVSCTLHFGAFAKNKKKKELQQQPNKQTNEQTKRNEMREVYYSV